MGCAGARGEEGWEGEEGEGGGGRDGSTPILATQASHGESAETVLEGCENGMCDDRRRCERHTGKGRGPHVDAA